MNQQKRAHSTEKYGVWAYYLCALMFLMLAFSFGPVARQTRTVRVGVYQNEPKIFIDQNNQASGFFIELLEKIAVQEGWTLVYVPCEWAACLQALEDGQIDLMPDVAYSTERDVKYDFHKIPVIESWSRVYSSPISPINKISDLDGKRVAVLEGSIQQVVFQQLIDGFGYKVTIVPVDSFEQAFALAADGSANAAITNHLFGDYFYQKHGLIKTQIDFNPVSLYYATTQGRNPDLLEAIDRNLGKWIPEANSPYYTTLGNWTAKEAYRIPTYVFWVLGGGLGLLVIAAGLILLLRQQVKVRTRHLLQINEELQASEQRYQTLAQISPVGIFQTDPNGSTTYVNPKWCAISGFSADQALGDGWLDAVHPDDREKLSRGWKASTQQQQASFSDYRFMRPDGTLAWVMGQAVPEISSDNQLIGYVGTITDITERKQAEARLFHINRLYATLSQLNQAIMEAPDRDTLFRETCRIAVEYGQFRLAWIGLIDETAQCVVPFVFAGEEKGYLSNIKIFYQDEESGQGPTGTAIREGRCVLCQDIATDPGMRLWRAAALQRGLRSSAAVPIRQANQIIGAFMVYAGEPRLFDAEEETLLIKIRQTISYALDGLTNEAQRRQAEADLKLLNLELESRVQERTEQLQVANRELESFSYSVSHDLRAPLRAISGFSEILARRHRSSLNVEGQHYLDNIVQASERMGHLIDDLLTYARLGRSRVRREPISLTNLLRDLARDMQDHLDGINGTLTIREDLPVVIGDETLLIQVFTNLLENAFTYNNPDLPPQVNVTWHNEDSQVVIEVCDNGIGIPLEYQEKIFNMFQRLHSEEKYPGTGIGLATVKKSVELLRGRVWVESKVGAGSTFFVQLPKE